MSAARDLFIEASLALVSVGGDKEGTYEKLCQAAELWRRDGQYFSAGVAMSRAIEAAWGIPERMLKAQRVGLLDFERVISEQSPDSPVSLAALYKLRQSLTRALWLFEVDRAAVKTRIREINSELAQRLLKYFGNSEHASNYLVRGIVIAADLDGRFNMLFPAYEVRMGFEQWGKELMLNIPSAFHLFAFDGDWQGAHRIVLVRKSDFTTPGLKGWKAVTLAYIKPAEAVAWFDEAADAFATDTPPDTPEEGIARGGCWSGENRLLWTKYFRARARLAESIRTPAKAKELIAKAAESLVGTEFGFHSCEVSRFRVLVSVLAKLISDPLSFSAEDARREYQFEIRISEETEDDRVVLTFIAEAAGAFRDYERDPASAITRSRLSLAIDALAKIPFIGPEVTEVVRPAIEKSALNVVFGSVVTWMHRALEGITSEAVFRAVLLRLLQAQLPLYAQVRHGPIEYGKDIAALLLIDGTAVLRLYQVKCGDIKMDNWRESKDELEAIFLVPLTKFQLPRTPDRIEGLLVTNGHANAFVEPLMEAWFQEREKQGWLVRFMHLDQLVDWIVKHRLVNELRTALREQGIETEP